jgi:hypothetical protein
LKRGMRYDLPVPRVPVLVGHLSRYGSR